MELENIINECLATPEMEVKIKETISETLNTCLSKIIRDTFMWDSPLYKKLQDGVTKSVENSVFIPKFGAIFNQLIEKSKNDAYQTLVLESFKNTIGDITESNLPKTMSKLLKAVILDIDDNPEDMEVSVEIGNVFQRITINFTRDKKEFYLAFHNGVLYNAPFRLSLYSENDSMRGLSNIESILYKLILSQSKLDVDLKKGEAEEKFNPDDYYVEEEIPDKLDAFIEEYFK